MQNHLSKPEDRMLQNAAPLRKSAPLLTCLMEMSLVLRLPREIDADLLQKSHACATKPSRFVDF